VTAISGAPADGWDADEVGVRIPDGITPIVAYRIWRVDHYGAIMSPSQELRWVSGDWVTARCRRAGDDPETDPPGHRAPAEGCTCGIYALKSPGDIVRLMKRYGFDAYYFSPFEPAPASGVVELSGKVIEHSLGYRAERARIVALVPVQWRRQERERLVRPAPSGTHPSARMGSTATDTALVPRPSGRNGFVAWARRNAARIIVVLLEALFFGLLHWFANWRHGL
jgi:hypothetical protein